MGCGPCTSSQSAVTDASIPLLNNFGPNNQYSPALTQLLKALDKVEIRMRSDQMPVSWKPSQFPEETVPYGQRPEGTEVVAKATPLYFEENAPYVYPLRVAGPAGGICEGSTLCAEPPANKVPGDTWQSFTWRMQGTAWETPEFCLKDLLFYENGAETLRSFLANVERMPSAFYDNFIRNLIWETGEKYLLAATDVGMLWNSPDRVSARVAPNIVDFRTVSPTGATADAAAPKLVAIQYLRYILEQFLGDDYTPFNINGQSNLMMVGVEPDIYSFAYNDTDVTPANWAQGGMGFNLFDFSLINKLPFATKFEKAWFRGDFDVLGEFYRIPAKVYVGQNGGSDLRTNPAWLTAPYGVLTFMTARPFKYKRFGTLPNMPSQVPAEAMRFLSPRFQWAPLLEKCNYSRGLVAWRAEDEFGFQPTGEKIIHVIYRRDELSAYLREAKTGLPPEIIEPVRNPIPVTCGVPEVLGCCPAPGSIVSAVDYRDSAYTVTYTPGLVDYMGWNLSGLPGTLVDAVFRTIKGSFNVKIAHVNTDGTMVTFYVAPTDHIGGHFCCTDQLLGFQLGTAVTHCQARLDGGLVPDPWDPTLLQGFMSRTLDAVATDTVAIFFDEGCGYTGYVEATVSVISGRRITLEVDPTDFPDGVNCADAIKVCAFEAEGCESCIEDALAECVPTDGLTSIDFGDDDHVEEEET